MKINILLLVMIGMFISSIQGQTPTTLFNIVDDAERVLNSTENTFLQNIDNERVSEKKVIDVSEMFSKMQQNKAIVPIAGKNYNVEKTEFSFSEQKRFTYKARFLDSEGEIYIFGSEGYFYGNIHIDSMSYQIEPISKRFGVLLNRNYTTLTCPGQVSESSSKDKNQFIYPNDIQTSNPIIDVLVVFSNEAAAATTNMQALADASIQSSNNTFSNSSAGVTFNLVHHQQIAYSESGYMDFDVSRLVNPFDGYVDDIHSLRDQYGADVVMLIVSEGKY